MIILENVFDTPNGKYKMEAFCIFEESGSNFTKNEALIFSHKI